MERKTGLVTHILTWWLRKPRSSSQFSHGLLGCHSSDSGDSRESLQPLLLALSLADRARGGAEFPRGVWETRLDGNHPGIFTPLQSFPGPLSAGRMDRDNSREV